MNQENFPFDTTDEVNLPRLSIPPKYMEQLFHSLPKYKLGSEPRLGIIL